jgi:hypothetical protein
MNLSRSYKKQKSRAQAMVEFALALPVLLTLIYGDIGDGTAAFHLLIHGDRSASGSPLWVCHRHRPNGVPYYQDCAGIENAAQNVGFINDFQDILIKYDAGPDGVPIESKTRDCPAPSVQNGDRIVVSVSAQWQPIVPIVPLEEFIIRSESARTILRMNSDFRSPHLRSPTPQPDKSSHTPTR